MISSTIRMSDFVEKTKSKSSHKQKDKSSEAAKAEKRKRRKTMAHISADLLDDSTNRVGISDDTPKRVKSSAHVRSDSGDVKSSKSKHKKTESPNNDPSLIGDIVSQVSAAIRSDFARLLDDQRSEIVTLRKLVQAMADRQNAELALENKQLKIRVANLEAEIAHIKADGIIASKDVSQDSAEETGVVASKADGVASTASDVLNAAARSAPLSSLTASRPKATNRKPSAYTGLSSSGNHLTKPEPAAAAAAVAASAAGSLASAILSPTQSTKSPAATEEIDQKSLTDDEIEAIRELFGKYDINDDGVIDRYEFELILEDLRKSDYMSNKISDGIFKKFVSANWESLDTDKSGSVDLQEFINFVESSKAAGNMFTKPLNMKLKKESQRNLSKLMTVKSPRND